jgi:glycerol dehydrogenase-like iron-containing ADH family enzyme
MLEIKVPQGYLNSDGISQKIGSYIAPFAQRILIISGQRAWQATSSRIEKSLDEYQISYHQQFLTGYCSENTVNQFAEIAHQQGAQLILGIGGGKVMDTAKAVGEKLKQLPVINLPTIAATCAAWSPISILYNDHGGQIGPLTLTRLPVWVLVDSEIIAQTDVRYLKAGIVDALAKWYEFHPYLRQGDQALSLLLKSQPAKLAVDTFVRIGQQAVSDNQRQQVTPELRQVIDANIALAGLANSMRDEIPRIGIAHAIHNSMTHIASLHDWLHGEKVGFGLMAQSLLESDNPATHQELQPLLKQFANFLAINYQQEGTQGELAQQIAQRINIADGVKKRLPFAIDTDRLASAIALTIEHYQIGRESLVNQ